MTWPDYPGTTLSVAKNLRTDQVLPEMPESSIDRDFVPPRERHLPIRDDHTILLVLLFAGLIIGLALAWLIGFWPF